MTNAMARRQRIADGRKAARARIQARHENAQLIFKLSLDDVSTSYALRTIAVKLEKKGHTHMADELLDLASAAALWHA